VDMSADEGIPEVTIETAMDCPIEKAYVFTAAQFAELRGEPGPSSLEHASPAPSWPPWLSQGWCMRDGGLWRGSGERWHGPCYARAGAGPGPGQRPRHHGGAPTGLRADPSPGHGLVRAAHRAGQHGAPRGPSR